MEDKIKKTAQKLDVIVSQSNLRCKDVTQYLVSTDWSDDKVSGLLKMMNNTTVTFCHSCNDSHVICSDCKKSLCKVDEISGCDFCNSSLCETCCVDHIYEVPDIQTEETPKEGPEMIQTGIQSRNKEDAIRFLQETTLDQRDEKYVFRFYIFII